MSEVKGKMSIFLRRAFGLLSSKVFLLWMIGGWIIYYVFSAIWMKEVFTHFTSSLSSNPLVQALFGLFLVSGYSNLIRVFKEEFRKKRGWFLLQVILPLGLVLFFTGLFLSLSTRQFIWVTVGEGQNITPPWGHESYTVTGVKSGLPDSFLDIDNSGTGIFAYEPKVTISDMASNSFEIGAFPPARIGDTYYHVLNFGFAPGIRLTEDGKVKEEGYMPLRILPPGNSDSFEIRPYPYRFLISLAPGKVIQKGRTKASQFNLKDPLYRVRVAKGEKMLVESVSVDQVRFDSFELSFFAPTFWVQLELVKDKGAPVILAGIFFIGIGFFLYLPGLAIALFRGRQ